MERCIALVSASRVAAAAALALAALLVTATAAAKDFAPGDLSVCNRRQCVPIANRALLKVLSSYYWGPGPAPAAFPPGPGAPAFELRFADGSVSGLVAGTGLHTFRAYGFDCGRFRRGRWYRFPPSAARELRKLTAGLRPLRVSAIVPPSC